MRNIDEQEEPRLVIHEGLTDLQELRFTMLKAVMKNMVVIPLVVLWVVALGLIIASGLLVIAPR